MITLILLKNVWTLDISVPAFSDGESITNGGVSEAGGEVDRDVLVPLLKPGKRGYHNNPLTTWTPCTMHFNFNKPVVLLDVVQVIPPDDSSPVHLQLGHHTSEDTSTDRHLTRQ